MVFYYTAYIKNMNIYFESAIQQAISLVDKLQKKDAIYHQNINPISVYGEMPINLECNHNLVDLFKEEFEEEIIITFVDAKSFIKGDVRVFEQEGRIVRKILLSSSNACWTRFYLCKELSQALIYEEKNTVVKSEDISNVLSGLINNTSSQSPQDEAENAPMFAAIEFLMPSSAIKNLLSLKNSGISNKKIAQKMLVPEQIVDFRLSDRGQQFFSQFIGS